MFFADVTWGIHPYKSIGSDTRAIFLRMLLGRVTSLPLPLPFEASPDAEEFDQFSTEKEDIHCMRWVVAIRLVLPSFPFPPPPSYERFACY